MLPIGFQRAAIVALALVWVAAALAYRESTLIADSAHVLVAASEILADGRAPAAGPMLYETWVASPLWFWLVALLMKVLPTFTAFNIAIGALAMTKLLLAWRIGLRVSGPLYGCVFALWMCWPGWSFIEPVIVAHTNLVQATGLLFTLAALRARESGAALRIVLMFAAFVLALATHATNLLLAPLFLLPLVRPSTAWKAQIPAWGMGAMLLALALLPSILHDASGSGSASGSFLARLPEPGWLARWPRIVLALFVDSQGTALHQVALHWPWLARALQGAYWIVLAMAGIGLLRVPREARAWLALVVLAVLAWCWALAVARPATPVWMLLSVQPVAYGILAYGLANLLGNVPLWRFRTFGLLFFLTVSASAALSYSALRGERAAAGFEWHASERTLDVSARPRFGAINAPHFPPRMVDGFEPLVCDKHGQRLALFGELAALAEVTKGASLRLADCPYARWPSLGPEPAARNVAGIPASIAASLELGGTVRAHLHLVDVERVIAPARGHRLRYRTRYPPYDRSDLQPGRIAIDTLLAADEILVVTSLLNAFVAPDADFRVDGAPLAAVADIGTSRFFRCPRAQPCRVRGTVAGGARRWIQAFIVKSASPDDRA